MKNFKILLCIIILFLTSCLDDNNKKNQYTDLIELIKNCKGKAIIIKKGIYPSNFENYKHSLLIRDENLNIYEYVGIDYGFSIGDTITNINILK